MTTDFVETQRTIIQFNGQDFYIEGPLQLDPASDFAQGVKTGPVDYDQRLHAFFQANDDHSAGEGYDQISAREDVGVYSHSTKGVDSRRSKHLTAPPFSTIMTQARGTSVKAIPNQNRHPISGLQNAALFDNGNLVVYGVGFAWVSTNGFTWKIVEFTPTSSVYALAKLVQVFSVGSTWHAIYQCNEVTAGVIPGLVDVTSTDGVTFTISSMVSFWDTIYWNGNFYAIRDTSIAAGASFASTTTTFGVLPQGRGQWFGPMLAPNGEVSLYFTKAGRLFFAEPTGQTITEVNLGPGFIVAGASFFDSNLIVTDGRTTIAYSSDGFQEIIRDVGFQNFRFAPHDVNGGLIRAMCADELNMYVGIQHDTDYTADHNECHISAYNGRGWHPYATFDDFYILNMGVGWVPPTGWPVTHRALNIIGIRGRKSSNVVLRPTGAGNHTAWTNDFANVDEAVVDDTDYVSSSTTDQRETFTFPTTFTLPDGMNIRSVILVARAANGFGANGDGDIQLSLRIDGTDYDGDTKALADETYGYHTQEWTTNPDTAVAWTENDINALEAGFQHVDRTLGETRVSQFYVVVQLQPDGDSETGVLEMRCILLPNAGSVPVPGVDHFAREWDLYEGWNDGGFIDLRGTIYELMASGRFTDTEYIDVYYSLDDDEDTETLLGRITESGQVLEFGAQFEGVAFRNYRLRFHGVNGAANIAAGDDGDLTLQTGSLPLGDVAGRTRLAQSFVASGNVGVEWVQFYVVKVGSPTDNLVVGIYADSAGAPGALLASATVDYDGSSLPTIDWIRITIPIDVTGVMTSGSTYWLEIRRSGAVDASNYYAFPTASAGYANGVVHAYDGANWSTQNVDLIFAIVTDKRLTADMNGYVVEYTKRPKYRLQGQFKVDANGMVKDGVLVNGEQPTFERVYNMLIELWDSETLIPYRMGAVRAGLCQFVTMPVTVDRVKAEDEDEDDTFSEGDIILQIIEPKPKRVGSTS